MAINPKVFIQVRGLQGPQGKTGKAGKDGVGVPPVSPNVKGVLRTDGKKTYWGDDKGDTYTFEQGQSSEMWIINHNLSKFPSVTVVDTAGTALVGEVTYLSKDSLMIKFSTPFTGKAYLN